MVSTVTLGFWIKVALGEVSTGVAQNPNAKPVCRDNVVVQNLLRLQDGMHVSS
jgi:hypothetical protein